MPTPSSAPPAALSTLPGAAILLRVRRLLVLGAVAAFVYSFLLHASRGYCADAPAPEESVLGSCVQLVLGPNPLVYVALALIVIVALGRVLKRETSVDRAVLVLDRAAIVMAAVVAGSLVIAYVWFFLIPIESWGSGGVLVYPFPFGTVELTSYPA